MERLFQEILKAEPHVAAGILALWIGLGIAGGLVLAGLLAFVLARAGALRLEGKHGPWLRILAVLWLLVALGSLGGSAGAAEGALRAAERIVTQGPFRTEVLRRAGEAVSAAIYTVDLCIRNEAGGKPLTPDDAQKAELDLFVKGGREFEAGAFPGRLEKAETALVRKLVDSARPEVQAKLSLPKSAAIEWLLDSSLGFLIDRQLRGRVREELEKAGAREAAEGLFAALDTSARAKGDPVTAAHADLADAIVERSLIPLILKPARDLARGPQLVCFLLASGAVLLPVLLFKFLRGRAEGKVDSAPAPGYAPGGMGGAA